MKRKGKVWFFVVAILIFALAYTAFFGISTHYGDIEKTVIRGAGDIRFGIDIHGGIDVTFMPADGYQATADELKSAEEVLKLRLLSENITDYEIYADYNRSRIIVRYPWKDGETDFNPEKAIQELGETGLLTFREGYEVNALGQPTGVTAENVILQGKNVTEAKAVTSVVDGIRKYYVTLKLDKEGTERFAEATTRLAESHGRISIWMDDVSFSQPMVSVAITEGEAIIEGSGDMEEATQLANRINAGSLPFKLSAESYSTISPTLGSNSLKAMVLAGVIAYALVAIYMIALYRLPGVIASIALLGQVAATIACISGYFTVFNSFTLTLPGIAGIILAIGMGVDANVITAERIKEEINKGKTLDGALSAGFKNGLTPIIDGNVTVIIVAAILMGAFGPTDGFFAKLFTPIFFAFGQSTAGTIYSFGYTLLIGVLLNFIMGVLASRIMLKSISGFKALRNPWLYGGAKNEK